MGLGTRGYFSISGEGTFGTFDSTFNPLEILSESFSADYDRYKYKNIYGSYIEHEDLRGIKRISGGVSLALNPYGGAFFIRSCLNNTSVTTILSGFLYKNNFTSPINDKSTNAAEYSQTIRIARDADITEYQYTGCVCNKLSIEYSPNNPVIISAEYVGYNELSTATPQTTITYPGSPVFPFTFDTVSLNSAFGSGLLDSLKIEIDNKIQGYPALTNDALIKRIKRTGKQQIRVRGSIDFSDETEYTKFINQSQTNLVVSVTRAASYQMVVDLPNVVYTSFPLGNLQGRNVVSFEGEAFYHASSATAILISLTNNTIFS